MGEKKQRQTADAQERRKKERAKKKERERERGREQTNGECNCERYHAFNYLQQPPSAFLLSVAFKSKVSGMKLNNHRKRREGDRHTASTKVNRKHAK